MRDRRARYPGRVKLTQVPGKTNIYDMERADEPEEAGTPINKRSLLTDETASEAGIDPNVNPTPDDVFNHIAKYTAVKPGDIRETTRTNLGDRWVLCNGDVVPEGEYPKLREILRYNTAWRRFGQFETEYSVVRPLPKTGQWAMLDVFKSTLLNGKTAALYDTSTETITKITCPTIDTTVRYGIFGLTHDGDRYILGVCEDDNDSVLPKVHLFTSPNLVTWALGYTLSPTGNRSFYDLTSDGVNILIASSNYTTSSMYDTAVYAVDKAMTSQKTLVNSQYEYQHYFYVYPSGFWGFTSELDSQALVHAYEPGTMEIAIRPTIATDFGGVAFFNDRYWIGAPLESGKSSDTIYVYDMEMLAFSYISLYGKIESSGTTYLRGMEYDKNDNTWAMYFTVIVSGGGDHYYIGYISADADPGNIANYTFVRVDALPENIPYGQMHTDRTCFREESTAERYLRDPNQKYIPSHDGDTLKYIYTG